MSSNQGENLPEKQSRTGQSEALSQGSAVSAAARRMDGASPAVSHEAIVEAIIENPDILADDALALTTRRYLRMQHSGPLPSAAEFGQYDKVLPGAAKDILGMAVRSLDSRVRQQDAQIRFNESALRGDLAEAKRGQMFALFITLTALGVGAWLIDKGHDVAGAAIIGGGLTMVTIAFLKGRSVQTMPAEQPGSK